MEGMEEKKSVEELIGILERNTADLQKAPLHGTESVWPVRKIVDALRETAERLGNLSDERAVRPLVEAVKEDDRRLGNERIWKTEVKWAAQAAVKALTKIEGREAIGGLIETLGSNNLEVRLTIARELAKTNDDRAISALKNASLQVEVKEGTGEITLPALRMSQDAAPIEIKRVTIRKQCVWCEHFADPEFFDPGYPRGGGYCRVKNGPTEFDSVCDSFKPNSRGSWWLQTDYMRTKYPQVSVWWKTA